MRKVTYLEAKIGFFAAVTGYNVTSRLPAELRSMGPWFARGDKKHGWHLTHGPSGMRGATGSTIALAIAHLAARPTDVVTRAVSSAPIIPEAERARALSVVTVEAAE